MAAENNVIENPTDKLPPAVSKVAVLSTECASRRISGPARPDASDGDVATLSPCQLSASSHEHDLLFRDFLSPLLLLLLLSFARTHAHNNNRHHRRRSSSLNCLTTLCRSRPLSRCSVVFVRETCAFLSRKTTDTPLFVCLRLICRFLWGCLQRQMKRLPP